MAAGVHGPVHPGSRWQSGISPPLFAPTHIHPHTHTHTYTHIHAHTHTYTYTHTHAHVRTHTRAHVRATDLPRSRDKSSAAASDEDSNIATDLSAVFIVVPWLDELAPKNDMRRLPEEVKGWGFK